MAQQNRTTLKTYFETGDKPTQAQFGDLIDSLSLTTETDAKQDTLVSATNLKTVNGITLLGSGNLATQSGFGEAYVSTPIATTFGVANTPTKALGTTTTSNLNEFSADSVSNRLKYTGTLAKTFRVNASISMLSSGSNKVYNFYVYYYDSSAGSGSVLARSKVSRKIGTGSDVGALVVTCNVAMEENDYIEIWTECVADTISITFQTMNLSII